MSQSNPYQPTTMSPPADLGIRKVSVRPIQLMQRAYALVRDQYWLFLGITVAGMLIGSAVPFGVIMGPILVGIYLCYIGQERGEVVEFSHLFRGFDSFKESFIAFLIVFAVAFVVMIPVMILMFVVVFVPIFAAGQQNGGGNGPAVAPTLPIATFLIMYPLILIANLVVTIPFLFAFQLIADRNLTGVAAVKASFQGVMKNLFGIIWYMIVLMLVSLILAMMCYVPAILFFPISFGSLFLLYRDVFPKQAIPQS